MLQMGMSHTTRSESKRDASSRTTRAFQLHLAKGTNSHHKKHKRVSPFASLVSALLSPSSAARRYSSTAVVDIRRLIPAF